MFENILTNEQLFDIIYSNICSEDYIILYIELSFKEEKNMKNVVRFISTKKIFIIAGIILVTVLYILISHKDSPATSASNASKKYYKCITIEEGDTLWDIANEYKTEEYASTQDYIDEVLAMNNLNTDVIVDGTNLLIPYYKVNDYE